MNTKFSIYILLAAILGFSSCKEEKSNGHQKVVKVKIATVTKEIINTPIRTSGIVASDKEAKLSFKTGGIIKGIYVNEGSTVRRGQLLAQLDLSEIRANVSQAELAMEKAKRDYERAKNLYNDSVATLEQFQNAKTALEYAETNVKIARFNLQHSTIVAPNNGKILMRLAENNEMIGPGYPVFLFGSTEKNWIVKVIVTDKDVVKLKIGDSAEIQLDAYTSEVFSGKITEIANASDPYTGTFEVKVSIDKTDKQIVSGMIAKVEIEPSSTEESFTIPVDALVEGDEFSGFVYILENNIQHKKKINIKRILSNKLVVEGLDQNTVVVTDGAKFLTSDTKIEIVK